MSKEESLCPIYTLPAPSSPKWNGLSTPKWSYQAGIPVVGLYTDVRQQGGSHPEKLKALQDVAESQFSYVNLYTTGLIKLRGEIVTASADLPAAVQRQLAQVAK